MRSLTGGVWVITIQVALAWIFGQLVWDFFVQWPLFAASCATGAAALLGLGITPWVMLWRRRRQRRDALNADILRWALDYAKSLAKLTKTTESDLPKGVSP